jgi:tyrosyl-tRNA synthetase
MGNLNNMYGKTMSLPDSLLEEYIELVTDFSPDKKNLLKTKVTHTPMETKKIIAHNIVQQFHSVEKADIAQNYFIETFSRKTLPAEIKEIEGDSINLVSFLVTNKLASSKSDARRLIEQKGIKINSETIENTDYTLKSGDTIQKGKLVFLKIR